MIFLHNYTDIFRLQLPFEKDGVFWNGRVDEFNNIGRGLGFSQRYGKTYFARNGAYGRYSDGTPKIHNGHDYAGPLGTPMVAPITMYVTYTGYDKGGYGNFIFAETETKKVNGEYIKLQMVFAHLKETKVKVLDKVYRGEEFGTMGSTGFSTGPHVHFGVRPIVIKNGKDVWLFKEDRGYVDPMAFLDSHPIEDKSKLLKYMRLVKKKGDSNVYAIDKYGKANLIINYSSYQAGLTIGLWEDKVDTIGNLPELGHIIVLTKDN